MSAVAEIVAGKSRRSGGDGIGGKDGSERRGGKRDAAFAQECAEFFEGAGDALLGGVFAAAQCFADGAKIALLVKAQQDGGAVFGSEFVDGLVEDGRDLGEVRLGMIGKRVHGGGLEFALVTATFTAHERGGDMAGIAMKPAAQGRISGQRVGLLREVKKNGLGDVLGAMRVTAHETEGGGINQIQITSEDFAKGRFGAVFNKVGKQGLSLGHVFSSKMPPEGKSRHQFSASFDASKTPLE